MKSANENKISFCEQGLEAMGSSFPASEIRGVANLRNLLLEVPAHERNEALKSDLQRCEAILEEAINLGVI